MTIGIINNTEFSGTRLRVDNGVTDGGALYFDGGTTTKYLKCSADGVTLSTDLVFSPGSISSPTISGDIILSSDTPSILDPHGLQLLSFAHVATAVNEITITNAAVNGIVLLAATGGDTHIGLDIDSKGTDALRLNANSTGGVNIGNTTGAVLVGGMSPLNTSTLQFAVSSNTAARFSFSTASNNASSSTIYFQKARGTHAIPAATSNADGLGRLLFGGQYDTTAEHVVIGAAIVAEAEENYTSATGNKTDLIFYTANTGVAYTECMRITSTGAIRTPNVAFTDEHDQEKLILNHVNSAVNEITITNAATTSSPSISATGDDTDIDLTLTPKGAGNVVITLAGVPTAANNAAADAAGVPVGGIYRTNADPSVLCIRSA